MLYSYMNFRVKTNKPNYILSRMPKIVYTEYDIDDEKEESENHKSFNQKNAIVRNPGMRLWQKSRIER